MYGVLDISKALSLGYKSLELCKMISIYLWDYFFNVEQEILSKKNSH